MSDTSVIFSILAVEKVTETLGKIPGAAAMSGAAIGLALAGGISKAMDNASANNVLSAQLGATPEMAQSFGKIAGNLYSQNFGESIADIDDALKGVMQNGLINEDASDAQIQAVTGKVINSSKLMGASYDEVSRTVSQMLRTGIAKNADEAFDILTRGMQQGVNKSGDLLDTFNEYPTQFRKLGLEGTQTMGLLSQAIQAGARDSDVAADALKEFSIRAVDGSKASADGFKALGLDAKKMSADIAAGGPTAAAALDLTLDRLRNIKDPVAQAAAATALFGTQAEDLGKALFAMDPSSAVQAMGDVAGATDKAGAALGQGAGAQLETFKRKVQTALVDKVAEALPTLEKMGKFANDNSNTLMTLGTVLGGVAIAVWAVNAASTAYKATQAALELLHAKDAALWVGRTAAVVAHGIAVGAIAVATGAATAAQWLWNVAMMMNPIGLIVLAVIAVIAVIWLLWEHSSGFRDFFIGVWDHIWGFLKGIGHWFAHDFVDFFVGAWNWIKSAAGATADWVVDKFNAFVGFFAGLPKRISGIASGMWDGLINSYRSAINFLIRGWNALDFGIHVHVPDWVPGIGGRGFDINDVIPDIPYLAGGGTLTRGGLVGMNEKGAEVVSLPTGATVWPHGTGPGGGVVELRAAPGDQVAEVLLKLLRPTVRGRYGGDVTAAMGGAG